MRAFSVLACFLFAVCMAFAPASAQSAGGTLTGTVSDTEGAPIAGAAVTLRGPSTYNASSDAKGTFEISSVAPGVYTIAVTKPGYATANQSDVAIISGETQTVAVRMEALTFSSLRTIATVRVGGKATINTSQAAVSVVNAQTFLDQSAPQVTRVLSQIPGLQISFPSNSANAAAPGAITVPNIRGATSYETASLIDGHPISVGQYGDNVTTFLNSCMFGNVEVVKGPGADSPVVNNAIGGTTNFRTKDPTATIEPEILAGFDNHGGSFSNFGLSWDSSSTSRRRTRLRRWTERASTTTPERRTTPIRISSTACSSTTTRTARS
jgi:iron complex outermembrane receptor protein